MPWNAPGAIAVNGAKVLIPVPLGAVGLVDRVAIWNDGSQTLLINADVQYPYVYPGQTVVFPHDGQTALTVQAFNTGPAELGSESSVMTVWYATYETVPDMTPPPKALYIFPAAPEQTVLIDSTLPVNVIELSDTLTPSFLRATLTTVAVANLIVAPAAGTVNHILAFGANNSAAAAATVLWDDEASGTLFGDMVMPVSTNQTWQGGPFNISGAFGARLLAAGATVTLWAIYIPSFVP